ncbi:hypothetical protein BLAT2472_20543 [Burkholderia latens]
MQHLAVQPAALRYAGREAVMEALVAEDIFPRRCVPVRRAGAPHPGPDRYWSRLRSSASPANVRRRRERYAAHFIQPMS